MPTLAPGATTKAAVQSYIDAVFKRLPHDCLCVTIPNDHADCVKVVPALHTMSRALRTRNQHLREFVYSFCKTFASITISYSL